MIEKNRAYIKTEIEGVDGELLLKEATTKEIKMRIKEGDKENLVLINNKNNVILNGKKVNIATDFIDMTAFQKGVATQDLSAFQLDGRGRYYNTTKCPYGKPSDYTKSGGKTKFPVNLRDAAIDIGLTALGVILALANPPIFVTVAVPIITLVFSYWLKHKIKSKWLGFIVYYKLHKKKGGNVKPGMNVWRRNIKVYWKKGYKGPYKWLKPSYRVLTW